MSMYLKERKGHGYLVCARNLNPTGIIRAVAQTHIFSPVFRRGTMQEGGTVKIDKDGLIELCVDSRTPKPGSRVILFEKAETYHLTEFRPHKRGK